MKKEFLYYLFGFFGMVGIAIFISHIAGFEFPTYFYAGNPNIEKYAGVNVVSAWADFSFFTYHTLVFFSLWCIAIMFAHIFKLHRFERWLTKNSVVGFIVTNYILTATVYTVMELASSCTFGYYASSPKALWSFFSNLIVHYVFVSLAIALIFSVNSHKSKIRFAVIFVSCYLVLYCITVKLTGMFCYNIEWYPYPIFMPSIWVIICLTIPAVLIYLGLYFLVIKMLNKQSKNNI